MTRTITRTAASISGLFALLLGLLALTPATGLATEFELARLASQLNQVSAQLAHELRYARGFGSVRISADRLAREAAQLVSAISRNRSPSFIRSQFRDVSRRYNNLENAFLRANRNNRDPRLFNDVGLISDLYASLSSEIYYTTYVEAPVYVYTPGIVTRRHVPSGVGRQGYVNPAADRQRQQAERRNRRDYGRISASQRPNYDHRSPVLDRQLRNDASRRRLDAIGSRRGGRSTETRRRNHYEN